MRRLPNGRFTHGSSQKTDTHRRCSVCRIWLPLTEYYPRKSECKECATRRNRTIYARMSDEDIIRMERRKNEYRNRKRHERWACDIADAKWAINILLARGMSKAAIVRATGVSKKTILAILGGKVKYVYKNTVRALCEEVYRGSE